MLLDINVTERFSSLEPIHSDFHFQWTAQKLVYDAFSAGPGKQFDLSMAEQAIHFRSGNADESFGVVDDLFLLNFTALMINA